MKRNSADRLTISLIAEGTIDKEFVIFLKTRIYKAKKIGICNNHSQLIKGTLTPKQIQSYNNCCETYVIYDKDEMTEEQIKNIKKSCCAEGCNEILTIPCLELILLAMFQDINSERTKDAIYKDLNNHMKQINLKFQTNEKKESIYRLCN